MNDTDIIDAIGEKLFDCRFGYDIAWPNKDFVASTYPYLVFQVVKSGRSSPELKGGETAKIFSDGFATITVVARSDRFATEAGRIADTIADTFYMGLRIPVTNGGTVEINKSSEPLSGFPNDGFWRVPVKVSYRARS